MIIDENIPFFIIDKEAIPHLVKAKEGCVRIKTIPNNSSIALGTTIALKTDNYQLDHEAPLLGVITSITNFPSSNKGKHFIVFFKTVQHPFPSKSSCT
jgi:hypothetical protein